MSTCVHVEALSKTRRAAADRAIETDAQRHVVSPDTTDMDRAIEIEAQRHVVSPDTTDRDRAFRN